MLRKGDCVFFRLGEDSPTRVLHRGAVEEVRGSGAITVRLEEPCPQIPGAVDAFVHFERRKEFMQQSARITRRSACDPLVFAVELRGRPLSAESRESYRVSCLGTEITATFATEARCEVLDVSATGFAVYARGPYTIGQCIDAALHYASSAHVGEVTIQSINRAHRHKTRYGVHCVHDPENRLARALPAIHMELQREQMRRISGAR